MQNPSLLKPFLLLVYKLQLALFIINYLKIYIILPVTPPPTTFISISTSLVCLVYTRGSMTLLLCPSIWKYKFMGFPLTIICPEPFFVTFAHAKDLFLFPFP